MPLNNTTIHIMVEKAFEVATVPRAYFIKSVKNHPSYIRRYIVRRRQEEASER